MDLDDVHVLLAGDLNSRVSDVSQDVCDQDDVFHLNVNVDCIRRCSEDKSWNRYGKMLLNMCTTLELCILNGVCADDQQGHFTYISETG